MRHFVDPLYYLFVLLFLFASLYYGISGYLSVDLKNLKEKAEASKVDSVTVGDTRYVNKYYFLYTHNTEIVEELFPYLKNVTEPLALIITAVAFGALGGVSRIFIEATFENVRLSEVKIFYLPILGMLCGIFVLGITYVIPTILAAGDQKVRPETLIFLALFAGASSKKFFAWLDSAFSSIFKTNKP